MASESICRPQSAGPDRSSRSRRRELPGSTSNFSEWAEIQSRADGDFCNRRRRFLNDGMSAITILCPKAERTKLAHMTYQDSLADYGKLVCIFGPQAKMDGVRSETV
jgi:hypothetical protein